MTQNEKYREEPVQSEALKFVSPRMSHYIIMQVLACQLHFLANKNTGLAIPSLFWPLA